MFTMPWSPTKDYMHPLAPMQSHLENKTSYGVVGMSVYTLIDLSISTYFVLFHFISFIFPIISTSLTVNGR